MTRKTLSIVSFFTISFCCFFWIMESAEAGRLGGGRSFGSRPSYQRSSPAPSMPQRGINQPPQQNPTAAPTPAQPWGGMFGGLIAGSLIGSLLFGGGLHGFSGFGMLDLLVLGGVLYFLLRFLRSRQTAADTASGGYGSQFPDDRSWGSADYSPPADPIPAVAEKPSIPPGFDLDEFIQGAKVMYTRLQSSWDKRDLEDIRQFTSPEVYAEIKRQAAEAPHYGKTDLLLINPTLLKVRNRDDQTVASVLYDVMLREDEDATARQVREIWHFSRAENPPGAFWVLEGIQQVEG